MRRSWALAPKKSVHLLLELLINRPFGILRIQIMLFWLRDLYEACSRFFLRGRAYSRCGRKYPFLPNFSKLTYQTVIKFIESFVYLLKFAQMRRIFCVGKFCLISWTCPGWLNQMEVFVPLFNQKNLARYRDISYIAMRYEVFVGGNTYARNYSKCD